MNILYPSVRHRSLRPLRGDGLGAYFANRATQPISGPGGGASTVAVYQAIQGLGAYYANRYTQPITGPGGGVSTVADYQPIGCAPCMAALLGEPAAPPAVSPRSQALLYAGAALAIGTTLWLLLRKDGMRPNGRRHQRNGRWSRRQKNSLPDSAFLYVERGGAPRIERGHKVTVPRALRKFPYRNPDGSVNLPHLRNAIARIPQSNLPESVKRPLQAKARALLAEHGGYRRARTSSAGGVLRKAA